MTDKGPYYWTSKAKIADQKLQKLFDQSIIKRDEINTAEWELNRIWNEFTDRAIELIESFSKELEITNMENIEIPASWECKDSRNPAFFCIYDSVNDPCYDHCLFCGYPEERK